MTSLFLKLSENSRSRHPRYSAKNVFSEISQNSQENTCARVSFLIKLQARSATVLKKGLWHRCFPVNFAKFLRTPFLQNTLRRLLLKFLNSRETVSETNLLVNTFSLFTLYFKERIFYITKPYNSFLSK